MTFATMHSDTVLFFQLHTQFLSSITSVCIGYVKCPISKITYFCAIPLWVVIGCIDTFQLYRRHRHPSNCNLNFNHVISVGGIYYGDGIQSKFAEWQHRHLFKLDDNFRALHQFNLAIESNEIQFNPNDSPTILNQIDLNQIDIIVDFTNLHFKTTNARPIFGQDVYSTIGLIDGPSYLFRMAAISCIIGYFKHLLVSFVLDVFSDIMAHGSVLSANFVKHQLVNVDTVASKSVHTGKAHDCIDDVSKSILGLSLYNATSKQLLLTNINLGDGFSGQNITQSAGYSEECIPTPLIGICNETYDAMTSDQTSAILFTTIHSDMVLLFRLHTQFSTFDSSICIGCMCSSISNVNDVCAISIWVIDRCVSTFRLCRLPHHLSNYHFDFSPAISVGGRC
jgi:hypothetical protein